MRTTTLRATSLFLAALAIAACADGSKDPVAPESRLTPSASLVGSNGTSGGKASNPVKDDGAVVSNVDCTIPLEPIVPGVVETSGHFVVSSSGNFHLVCHGTTPTPPVPSALVFEAPCTVPTGQATTGHVVITPSGRVHLVCHGKAPDGDPT
jgi:hypothetical protein